MPVFVASVNRRHGRKDFSNADLARLKSIHAFVNCAVNRLHELEATRSVRDGMAMTVRRGALGVVVLDWNLCHVEANAVARRMCATWGDMPVRSRAGRSRRTWRLPVALANACRELRTQQASCAPAIPHPHLLGVTASISMISGRDAALGDPSFVIELERIERPEHPSLLLQRMTSGER